jgi:hypothetical protein
MAITYNKQYVTKDRRIMPSGPRDRQLKQQMLKQGDVNTVLVEELRNQIRDLQKQLSGSKTSVPEGMFTAEQVNSEIVKAIQEETAALKKKHKQESQALILELEHFKKKFYLNEKDIDYLKSDHDKEVSRLNEIIKTKDEMIQQLKASSGSSMNEEKIAAMIAEATKKMEVMAVQSSGMSHEDTDPDRPKMDVQFVDPIEKESEVETHIEVKDVSSAEKEKMTNNINKLKSLLGSLPSEKR